MFSVIFPGQGSQSVGMAKDLYNKFDIAKELFKEADSVLNFSISKLIFNGTKKNWIKRKIHSQLYFWLVIQFSN